MTGRGGARGCLVGLLLAVGVTVGGPGDGMAQEPGDVRVGIRYDPGYVPGLAMAPVASGEELAGMAARVDTILRRDLEYSDRFEMVRGADSLRARGTVNYGLWNELGAVWLVSAQVSGTPGRPLLRVILHDVVYSDVKDVEAFALPPSGEDGFRMAVHRAADAVVEWATGTRGMAATRIAYRRKREDGTSDIWVVDSDGHRLRRMTSDSSIVYSPAFSPDGSRMLYVSYARGGGPAVYEKNLRSGRTRPVDTGSRFTITPTYSPDGGRIAYARTVGDHSEIFLMEADPPCCARRVTRTGTGDALNPSFSPSGERLAFTANRLGQPQVYVKGLGAGGSPHLISRYVYGETGYATSPDWSPRGRRIAYHGRVDGVFQIMTVNPDGTDRRILTSRGRNEDPAWAPDGRHLVFSSTREGYHGLWVLDTVSGRLRRLTANQEDQMPAWSGPIVRAARER